MSLQFNTHEDLPKFIISLSLFRLSESGSLKKDQRTSGKDGTHQRKISLSRLLSLSLNTAVGFIYLKAKATLFQMAL